MKHIFFVIPSHINPDVKFGGVENIYATALAVTKYLDGYTGYVIRKCPELKWLNPEYKQLERYKTSDLFKATAVFVPEVAPQELLNYLYIPNRIIFAQAADPLYIGNTSLDMFNCTAVACVSNFVKKAVKEIYTGRTFILHDIIPEYWLNIVEKNRRRVARNSKKILLVDRKGAIPFNRVVAGEVKKIHDLEDCDVVSVRGASTDEFVKHLLGSRIVVVNYENEGFNRIPLEAMLCGCIPVCYHGGGGLEYMKHKVNSLVVPRYSDINRFIYNIKWAMCPNFFTDCTEFNFKIPIRFDEKNIARVIGDNLI